MLQGTAETVVTGTWGMSRPQVHTVPMHRILARKPFHVLIRTQRCAVPANAFFGLRNGKPYLFKLLKERLFCFGGIYTHTGDHQQFAILTTEPPQSLRPFFDAFPVLFPAGTAARWLKSAELWAVMNMADRSPDYVFDYFPVSEAVLQAGNNSRELLTPQGQRFSEVLDAQRKQQAAPFMQYRRRRGKG